MTTTSLPTTLPDEHTGHAGVRRAASDAAVLVQRSLRHATRNLESLLTAAMLPVMLLLLFVYVFGGAISTRADYIDYVVPGIILLCAGFGASATATSVCLDMTGGMIDRFRSLPIRSSAAVLGHVVASVARNLLSTLLVIGVAIACGFRPTTNPLAWFGVLGLVALYVLAISWVAVVWGLLAKSVEGAAALGFFLLFVPYLSSAFVPTDTLPAVVRPVAEHQPITPVIQTVRGLLVVGPIGNNGWVAVAWCAGIVMVAAPLSARLFRSRAGR